MDQVSRPMLIALAATVVLAVAWMGFLRPRAVESTTEQVTAPAQVATQAQAAAAATDAANAAEQAAANAVDGTATTTQAQPAPTETTPKAAAPKAKPQAAKPAQADPKDPQAKLLADLDAKKVVVLLIWDKAGADDRAARAAVRHLDRRGGKVAVHVAKVADVGRYESITQGVDVTQTPTTIVIAPTGIARSVVGLSDRAEVDGLVRAALKAK